TNNVASLVGHHTLRMCANGMDRLLRPSALGTMIKLANEAFAAGAVGLSTGLIYTPGSYATTEEIMGLASAARRWQRPYATHIRDEGDHLESALNEAFAV